MSWHECKNILCIRPDNMGDLVMSIPAIRALKETFGARITVLTSSMAKAVIPFIPEIDDAIIYDLPWVKTNDTPDVGTFNQVVQEIKSKRFDAAVIFTVYSQNPLPTAMIAYLAGIPKVLAYCRENPYHLVSDWVPDKEPYTTIKHQVQRDLDLVAAVGATTPNVDLSLQVNDELWQGIIERLSTIGFDDSKPWLLMHAGVSEAKRQYPEKHWVTAAQRLIEQGYRVLFTGSSSEKTITDNLHEKTGRGSFSCGGMFNLDEFICLIKHSSVVVSVNTGTVHLAAAVGTPVVVLYAQTNPQHTPWNVPNIVLPFPVPAAYRSKNEVISYVNKTVYSQPVGLPTTDDISRAVEQLTGTIKSESAPVMTLTPQI